MARTITIDNLEADLRYLGDLQGLTVRHDQTNVFRLLNKAIQTFREKVSQSGINHFLVSVNGTLTPGATAPYQFSILDLSAVSPNVVRVYGVDVQVTGVWIPLDGVEFTRRNDYQAYVGVQNAPPVAFANFTTYKLAIFPPPLSAYPYIVWYLPVTPDLTTGQTFDGITGWEKWVIWEALIGTINRDQYEKAYAIARQEQDRAWADVVAGSSRVNRATFTTRKDTWGARLKKAVFSRNRGTWYP